MEHESQSSPALQEQEQKQHYLTPDVRGNAGLLRKSNSQHSFNSGTTEVCDNPDYVLVERDDNFTTLTSDVEIPLTRWEIFKMLLFGNKRRTVPVEVEVANVEKENEKRDKPSRYNFRVLVRSRRRDEDGRWIHEDASCTIDTGNQQGNFVSKEFVDRLGYLDADFRDRELDVTEKEGRSATGHPLRPEGAIRLSWYRPGGPKTFDKMRFLVSSEVQCDLLIGEASITEHNMLPPPMLAITTKAFHDYYNPATDVKRQNLVKPVEKYEAEIDTLKQEIKESQVQTRKKTLEGQLRKQEEKLSKAKADLTTYEEDKKKQIEATSKNTSQPTSNGSETHISKGCPPQPYSSEVIATFAGGIKRQATGFTMRVSRKK